MTPTQIPAVHSAADKLSLKLMQTHGTQSSQNNAGKAELGGPTRRDFGTHCTDTMVKVMWLLARGQLYNRWPRKESPEINPHTDVSGLPTRMPREFTGPKKYWDNWI